MKSASESLEDGQALVGCPEPEKHGEEERVNHVGVGRFMREQWGQRLWQDK